MGESRLLSSGIRGRVTTEAIGALAARIDELLDGDGPFAVVFDRRAMTAPTRDGRVALEEWASAALPAPDGDDRTRGASR